MNDTPRKPSWLGRLNLAIIAFLLAIGFFSFFADEATALTFGGVRTSLRLVREHTWITPASIAFLLGVVALGIGVHLFAHWLAREIQRRRKDPAAAPWRFRWTSLLLGLIMLFFVAGICGLGVVHQTTWLVTDPEGVWTKPRPSFTFLPPQ